MADAKAAKKVKKHAPKIKGAGKKACTTEGCKRAYRAKGYCFFHYSKWRRGELGHSRYKTCGKEDCVKKVFEHGFCEEHFKAWKGSRKGAVVAAAAAPAA